MKTPLPYTLGPAKSLSQAEPVPGYVSALGRPESGGESPQPIPRAGVSLGAARPPPGLTEGGGPSSLPPPLPLTCVYFCKILSNPALPGPVSISCDLLGWRGSASHDCRGCTGVSSRSVDPDGSGTGPPQRKTQRNPGKPQSSFSPGYTWHSARLALRGF